MPQRVSLTEANNEIRCFLKQARNRIMCWIRDDYTSEKLCALCCLSSELEPF